MAGKNISVLSQENWQQEVNESELPVLVDFWADWCGPCKRIAPIVEELAEEYAGRLKVGKLDVDQYPDLASQYGILSIPTLLIFKGGEPVGRIVGLQPKEALRRQVDQVL